MKLQELNPGDQFYFSTGPRKVFTYLDTVFDKHMRLRCRAKQDHRLRASWFSPDKTVVKINLNQHEKAL